MQVRTGDRILISRRVLVRKMVEKTWGSTDTQTSWFYCERNLLHGSITDQYLKIAAGLGNSMTFQSSQQLPWRNRVDVQLMKLALNEHQLKLIKELNIEAATSHQTRRCGAKSWAVPEMDQLSDTHWLDPFEYF